jgi:membrane protein required for colicin V production
MHFIDIISIIACSVFVGFGIKRGFIGEIFRLAAVIIGFIAAFIFYKPLYDLLSFITMPGAAKTALSFLVVYAVIALGVLAVGWVVKKVVHLTLLGWLDRLLGATVGLAKALLLIWLMVLCVQIAPSTAAHKAISKSWTFRIMTAMPLRLKSPSPASLPKLKNVVDVDSPAETIRKAKEKLDTYKHKVDSAKKRADSLGSAYNPGDI